MSLEDIEKELYGQRPRKNDSPHVDQKKSITKKEIPPFTEERFGNTPRLDPWGSIAQQKMRSPVDEPSQKKQDKRSSKGIGRVIVGLAFTALVVLLGFATYYLYQYFTTKDIVVAITVPHNVLVGESFTAHLTFENISKKSLTAPHITLALPDGVMNADEPDKRVIEEDTHDITPQETIQTTYNLMVSGKPLQTYILTGSVAYGYESSSLASRFEKQTTASLAATDSVLGIDVTTPPQTLNGQEFNIEVRYQNMSNDILHHASVAFMFPDGFTVTGGDVSMQDNTVSLPDISPHDEGILVISGYMVGDEYSYFTIPVSARVTVGTNAIEVAGKTVSISITPSPLAVHITRDHIVNGQDIVYPGDKLSYTITSENTGEESLQNVVVTASLVGSAFDMTTLEGTGHLQDVDNTYTWTAAQIKALKEIAPHIRVDIPLTISLRKDAGNITAGGVDKIVLKAQATSPTVPTTIAAKETIGMGQLVSVIGGALGMEQTAYFVDPSAGITNNGSLPPQVGKEIQYTIHWKLSGAGDFDSTVIQATLPAGVSWTGKIKVNGTDSVPEYNDRTQEIVWVVPKITSKDLAQQAPEAIFQIAFTPSSQNSGSTFSLISDTHLTSTETLSGKSIDTTVRGLTSRQLSDVNLKEGYYRVVPAGQ